MTGLPSNTSRGRDPVDSAAVTFGLLGVMIGAGRDLISTPTWRDVSPSCLGHGLIGFVCGYALFLGLVLFGVISVPARDNPIPKV